MSVRGTTIWHGNREVSWSGGSYIYDGTKDASQLYSAIFQIDHQPMVVVAVGFPPNLGSRCGSACIEHVFGSNDGTDFVPVRLPISEQPLHLCCAQNTIVVPISGRYRVNLEELKPEVRRGLKIIVHPTTPVLDYSAFVARTTKCDH